KNQQKLDFTHILTKKACRSSHFLWLCRQSEESKNYSPFIRKYKGFMIKYIGLFIEKRQSTALGECCTSDLRLFFMKGRPSAREDWTRRIDRLS
ncbi:hypothetical protein P9B99_23255, partial [Bacillus paralicheniformis]|uniref:hypothetical protein n=1 Tax=Bacillus paralicheniformis TaxID=1648923 RepID=UPI002DB646CC